MQSFAIERTHKNIQGILQTNNNLAPLMLSNLKYSGNTTKPITPLLPQNLTTAFFVTKELR